LHSSHPVRTRRCAGNIETVFARQKIGDHHYRNPRFAFEKRFHHRWIKVALKIDGKAMFEAELSEFRWLDKLDATVFERP